MSDFLVPVMLNKDVLVIFGSQYGEAVYGFIIANSSFIDYFDKIYMLIFDIYFFTKFPEKKIKFFLRLKIEKKMILIFFLVTLNSKNGI